MADTIFCRKVTYPIALKKDSTSDLFLAYLPMDHEQVQPKSMYDGRCLYSVVHNNLEGGNLVLQ